MDGYKECNGKATFRGNTASQPLRRPAENLNWLIYRVSTSCAEEEARQLITSCLESDCDKEFLHQTAGVMERKAGNLSKSLESFNQALLINPKNPVTFREMGKSLYEMHRFQAALETLRKAETLMQRIDCEVYFFIGEILRRRLPADPGLIKDIEEYYKMAIMNGKHRQSYLSLAEIYERANDFAKATELYESCILVSNRTTDILFRMGLAYLKMRENQRAFEKLLDVTYIDAHQKGSLLALGGILQGRGDADGALRRYRTIPDVGGDAAELWNNIGLCFNQKRKLIAAVANLRKAFFQSPLNFSIAFNLGLVLIRSTQYASAFQILAASVNFDPSSALCYTLLGICLACLGDHVNAELAFEQSLLFLGSIPVQDESKILLNAAIFCYHIGKRDRAVLLLKKHAALSEANPVASDETRVMQKLHHELMSVTSGGS